MKIEIHKTHELTENQWLDIVHGFNQSFDSSKTVEGFKAYYSSTYLGYSIHAIVIDEEKDLIVGYNSIIPMRYNFKQESEVILGLSGGTYVLKEYRKDIFIYIDMIKTLKEYCKSQNYYMTFGVSNKNSFKLSLKINGDKLAGFLPYYILPISASKLLKKPILSLIDYLIYPCIWLYAILCFALTIIKNSSEKNSQLELVLDSTFYENRFNSSNYTKYISGSYTAYYRIMSEQGIRTAYLFDFRTNGKRTTRALVKTLMHIILHNKVDIIIFVGELKLSQFILFKIPRIFEPQKFPITYTILNPEIISTSKNSFSIKDINFGLMNFDVR